MTTTPSRRRTGVVLVLVLIVISLLALAGLGFAELMLTERKAAMVSGRRAQARAMAESGLEMALQLFTLDATTLTEQGGLYDNSQLFCNVLVADDDLPRDRGYFTFVAPRIEDRASNTIRNGLEDESTKINLCTLLNAEKTSPGSAKTTLLGLPGMTEDVADAILDWLDKDADPREQGAEAEYYGSLSPPYEPRNGPPLSLDELLLVRGVTPQLLFGNDAARIMQLPSAAMLDNSSNTVDNADGSMDHGWVAYLTLYSLESTSNADGNAKINLNDKNLETLYNKLSQAIDPQWATFIVAYRQGGPQQSGASTTGSSNRTSGIFPLSSLLSSLAPRTTAPSSLLLYTTVSLLAAGQDTNVGGKSSSQSTTQSSNKSGTQTSSGTESADSSSGSPTGTLDFSKKATTNLTSVLDLIGAKTSVTFKGQKKATVLTSPFSSDSAAMGSYLPKLLDATTCSSNKVIAGRININQASRVVLATIPGMPADAVDQILAKRSPDPSSVDTDTNRKYETWLLTEGIVTLKNMKKIMPYVCAGGSVYRAQIIGHFAEGGPPARLEVIIDATKKPAAIVSWKDVSQHGVSPLEIAAPVSTESGGQ